MPRKNIGERSNSLTPIKKDVDSIERKNGTPSLLATILE
jgi:hypothetical protein